MRINVLIVDDSSFNIMGLQELLKHCHFINRIDIAYNGQEAVEKFTELA